MIIDLFVDSCFKDFSAYVEQINSVSNSLWEIKFPLLFLFVDLAGLLIVTVRWHFILHTLFSMTIASINWEISLTAPFWFVNFRPSLHVDSAHYKSHFWWLYGLFVGCNWLWWYELNKGRHGYHYFYEVY